MKALLIIDMQVGLFKPDNPRYDAEGVVQRINTLSGYFRKNGDKVIFVQHDGTKEGEFIPGTQDWEILPSLTRMPSDMILRKTANDAFYKTELEQMLHDDGIQEIAITGCATDFCVNATIQSGLNYDFRVFVIKDGHTTADRPHLTAEQVIQHYNWRWENMIPTGGLIKVVSLDEYVKEASCNII